MSKQVLLTGDYWHADFVDLIRSIETPLLLVPFQNLNGIERGAQDIGLIILAQSRRSQFPREEVQALQRQFPGIPLINILGSWCEGESRSGEPYEGWVRLYWYQWRARFDLFRQAIETASVPSWALPKTASAADRLLHAAERTFPRHHGQLLGIFANSSTQYEMLADALDACGYLSVWCPGDEVHELDGEITGIVVDADSINTTTEQQLTELSASYPGLALVLVLGFPRNEEVQRASILGVDEVVAKPFQLDDLRFAVSTALASRRHARRGDR